MSKDLRLAFMKMPPSFTIQLSLLASTLFLFVSALAIGYWLLAILPYAEAQEPPGTQSSTMTVSVTIPGGGGGRGTIPTPTGINFSGMAYPGGIFTLLEGPSVIATAVASPDGNFTLSPNNVLGGTHVFSMYAEDGDGLRSSMLTFALFVPGGATTNISGIFLSPTLSADKSEVAKGDTITFSGYTMPNATINFESNPGISFLGSVYSGGDGRYSLVLDTKKMNYDENRVRVNARLGARVSDWSRYVDFIVGKKSVPKEKEKEKCPQRGDLNSDCRVDLVDFSIAAYWYERPLSAPFIQIEPIKLNADGVINLTDFSVMAYWWTG